MFCTTCGRQIINDARFCNFCGAPVRVQAQPAAPAADMSGSPAAEPSEIVSQPYGVPAREAENGAETDITGTAEVPVPADTALPDTENIYGARSAAYRSESVQPTQNVDMSAGVFCSAAAPSYPMPGEIPQSGGDPSGNYSIPTSGAYAAPDLEKPKPERRYTLTHIILCLSSTAIMAIAAGIFAGLYFSVV